MRFLRRETGVASRSSFFSVRERPDCDQLWAGTRPRRVANVARAISEGDHLSAGNDSNPALVVVETSGYATLGGIQDRDTYTLKSWDQKRLGSLEQSGTVGSQWQTSFGQGAVQEKAATSFLHVAVRTM